MIKKIILLSVSFSLFGCITSPSRVAIGTDKHLAPESLPSFNNSLFTVEPVISRAEITALTDEQKADFFEFFNNPKYKLLRKNERIASYLGLLLDQLKYSENTFTAKQSLSKLTGNCLSLTVLTSAYAELANVDISFQLLDQNPVYSIDNDLLVTSNHIRAVLKTRSSHDEDHELVSHVRIDFFNTEGLSFIDKISTDIQLSLFYSNLAAEKLGINDLDGAFSYANHALGIYSANSSALNLMGIVHQRRGDLAKAEEIYRHGAKYFGDAPVFINNYAALLNRQGRDSDLGQLLEEATENNNHPWIWVRAGRQAVGAGKYTQAITYYKKALEIAPDVHQIYAFAGAASFVAGDKIMARGFFDQALVIASEAGDRARYKGKLRTLERQ